MYKLKETAVSRTGQGVTMNPFTISACSNAAATIEADDKAAINDLY